MADETQVQPDEQQEADGALEAEEGSAGGEGRARRQVLRALAVGGGAIAAASLLRPSPLSAQTLDRTSPRLQRPTSTLGGLSDVSDAAPQVGDTLVFDGTAGCPERRSPQRSLSKAAHTQCRLRM